MKEADFIEAIKILSEGKCEEIETRDGTCYVIRDGGLAAKGFSNGDAMITPDQFFSKWKLVGLKTKVFTKMDTMEMLQQAYTQIVDGMKHIDFENAFGINVKACRVGPIIRIDIKADNNRKE